MRIMKIILTELAADKLKAEENLESATNSDGDAGERTLKIKASLEKIILCEQMIVKWQSYMAASDESNNN